MVSSALACLGFRVFDSVGQGYYFLGFVFYHPPAHLVPSHFLSSPSSCCPSFRAASSVFLFSFGRVFFVVASSFVRLSVSLLLCSLRCSFLCSLLHFLLGLSLCVFVLFSFSGALCASLFVPLFLSLFFWAWFLILGSFVGWLVGLID